MYTLADLVNAFSSLSLLSQRPAPQDCSPCLKKLIPVRSCNRDDGISLILGCMAVLAKLIHTRSMEMTEYDTKGMR